MESKYRLPKQTSMVISGSMDSMITVAAIRCSTTALDRDVTKPVLNLTKASIWGYSAGAILPERTRSRVYRAVVRKRVSWDYRPDLLLTCYQPMLPSPFTAWGSVLSACEAAGNKKSKIILKYAFSRQLCWRPCRLASLTQAETLE